MAIYDDDINKRFNRFDFPAEKVEYVMTALDDIAAAFIQFAEHMNKYVMNPRCAALMLDKLEEAQSWAEKGLKTQD